MQHLVFSSQRATDEGIEGTVTQNAQYTNAAVWTDAQDSALSDTLMGLPSPVHIQQRDNRRLYQNLVTFCMVRLLFPASL